MSVELPEKLDTTNIYRVLTALGMGGCLILGVKIWSGQDDKFGDMKASLKIIADATKSTAVDDPKSEGGSDASPSDSPASL